MRWSRSATGFGQQLTHRLSNAPARPPIGGDRLTIIFSNRDSALIKLIAFVLGLAKSIHKTLGHEVSPQRTQRNTEEANVYATSVILCVLCGETSCPNVLWIDLAQVLTMPLSSASAACARVRSGRCRVAARRLTKPAQELPTNAKPSTLTNKSYITLAGGLSVVIKQAASVPRTATNAVRHSNGKAKVRRASKQAIIILARPPASCA